jgi:hypothetical protein
VYVQIAGEGLATTARFTGDQYPAVVLGDTFNLLSQTLNYRAVANGLDDRRGAAFEADVLLRETVGLEGALDRQ